MNEQIKQQELNTNSYRYTESCHERIRNASIKTTTAKCPT